MGDERNIRIVIVEDDARYRDGLRQLIEFMPGYECFGEFYSVESALRAGAEPAPDVLLLDIDLRGGVQGSEGVPDLRAKWPRAQVLMLTSLADEDKVFRSICNGACGYLLKKTRPDELLKAIRDAHEGGSPFTPEVARKVISYFQRGPAVEALEEPLTEQEVRLLGLIAEGYSYENSAGQLNVSINTVRSHIRNIYRKLHVNTKSEAVSKAIRHRLIG
ncbi:MAG TPA: response regulator transcription factor [Pyrinomonadaceae bacterium]